MLSSPRIWAQQPRFPLNRGVTRKVSQNRDSHASPEPWRDTQDLTEPRPPRFPQNRGVTRKVPRLPITQQSESHTVREKAENWEAYKKVANEGKRVGIFEIRKEIKKEEKTTKKP